MVKFGAAEFVGAPRQVAQDGVEVVQAAMLPGQVFQQP